ncbi:MAG: AlpA family phage regulatory protein [Magnetococcales bacterium]|nr:AlpA family phage regulatory protein [Magnetococcales bacterium]
MPCVKNLSQLDSTEYSSDVTGVSLSRERLLRLLEVIARTGCPRSKVDEKMRKGEFPTPVAFEARARAWRELDITHWIVSRVPTASTGK